MRYYEPKYSSRFKKSRGYGRIIDIGLGKEGRGGQKEVKGGEERRNMIGKER